MQDEMVVVITASGVDHKKARRIREEIQKVLEKLAGE
jgi:siroheme synthase (precorrin-2 oxidase/ferrochelatase)